MSFTGWNNEVITYTGDGTSGRTISTTFALDTGVVAVEIYRQAGSGGGSAAMRHNAGSGIGSMPVTTIAGSTTGIANGITSFTSSGFVVGNHAAVNGLGSLYTAVVLRDTSPSNSYLIVGSYAGDGVASTVLNLMKPIYHLWVWGQDVTYLSEYLDVLRGMYGLDHEFEEIRASGNGLGLFNGATGTTLGDYDAINKSGTAYYFIGLGFAYNDGSTAFFSGLGISGNASGGGRVVPFSGAFEPAFVAGRLYTAASTRLAWRGPAHTGASASRLATTNNNTYLEAVASGTVTLGSSLNINHLNTFGWAWASTGSGSAATGSWWHLADVEHPNYTDPVSWSYYGTSPPSVSGGVWASGSEPSPVGWWFSREGFAGQSTVIESGIPHNPRSFAEIVAIATGGAKALSGSPGAAVVVNNNRLIYPSGGYTVGTDNPSIRIFDGISDRHLVYIPTASGTPAKAIMSMLAANGKVYVSTLDGGSSAADWTGRVFELDLESATLTPLGAQFTTGELPYALAWHNGRLWVGSNQGDGTTGKVYWFRPGIDTAWTTDYTLSSSSQGGACAMVSYRGNLVVGCDNVSGTFAKVIQRSPDGTWADVITGSSGTAKVNNGFYSMREFQSNLYIGYWNEDATAIAKIYRYDGSTGPKVYEGATGTLRPYIGMFEDSNTLYVIGGGAAMSSASLLKTTSGTTGTWTDVSSFLTDEATATSVFGALVI